ncbi:MAG: fibronectin type III domain-containing protein, partial [Actinomycetes bacterium]
MVARDVNDLAGGGQTASGVSGPITVDGLRGGHSYVFDVTATNSAGSTTANFAFVSCVAPTCVVPVTIPDATAAPTATRGNKSAEVAFQAPSGNGGEITRYTVTATDLTNADAGGQSVSGTTSPITVHGLTNGDEYTFKVTATNEAGEGPASASSNSVTPLAVPDAPSSVE